MKKLITIILIIAMILPAVSSLADESDVVGGWVSCYSSKEAYSSELKEVPCIRMMYLTEDHICYYLIKTFDSFFKELSSDYVGSWEMNQDGTVRIQYGRSARTIFEFSQNYDTAIDQKTGELFVNVSKFYVKE